jgi:hypothetical protein
MSKAFVTVVIILIGIPIMTQTGGATSEFSETIPYKSPLGFSIIYPSEWNKLVVPTGVVFSVLDSGNIAAIFDVRILNLDIDITKESYLDLLSKLKDFRIHSQISGHNVEWWANHL